MNLLLVWQTQSVSLSNLEKMPRQSSVGIYFVLPRVLYNFSLALER